MFRLLSIVLILSIISHGAEATRRRTYTLTVSYAPNSSSIVLINNQFPGPLIQATVNDILVIRVRNNLPNDEKLTIHYHGMFQHKTPQMDGAAYITQMPIPTNQTFTYVFRADQTGTYFYHSHSGLQAVTAFGPLIIHESRKQGQWQEIPSGPLLFSDQWLTSDRRGQEEGLLGSPFRWEGEPTGLLINGRRNLVITLQPNRKYLLRLIGATSLSTIVFAIDQHPMTVVEVDGTVVKPKERVTSIEITSGQRYAVVIETKNQTSGVFVMKAAIRWRSLPVNSSCTSVLRYGSISQVPSDLSTLPEPSLANETDLLSFAWVNPYETERAVDTMPTRTADREYFLLGTQDHTSDGLGIRWLINNATLDMSRMDTLMTPLLFNLYNGNPQHVLNDVTYTINHNELVDIVIQNTVALNGVCESHPFHLHGHKFWLHSYGAGMYDKLSSTSVPITYPVLRDTVILYASEYAYFTLNRNSSNHLQPCGWIKLRMVADNPGLWMLHCHIGAHSFMGMNVLLKEDINNLKMEYLSQH